MNTNISKSATDQATAIAQKIQDVTASLITTQGHATIAVSGGKSPIALFQQLSNTELQWDKITITLVDERMVATDSEDSNEHLVRAHLLQNKAAGAKFIGLMQQNKTEEEILFQANIIPEIDLAVLGMGEDGHTASIFPDCPELQDALDMHNKNRYIITNPIAAQYPRISLTLNALSIIPHLLLSISSETKLNILKESRLQPNLNYPISYLLHHRPELNIYWHQ